MVSDSLFAAKGRSEEEAMEIAASRILAAVVCFLALISAVQVPALAGSDVKYRQVINATPDVLQESVPSNDLVRCARVTVSGLSRLKLCSYSNGRRITLVPSDEIPEKSRKKIQICLHNNSSLGLCQCENDNWESTQGGIWSSTISPYGDRYIDVKFVNNLSGSVTGSVGLVPQRWRLLCLAIGLILLLVAPIVSSWVPFYYSSSMAIGVCLVIIILLFQGMKLLPTGRKNALYSTICGLALGAGSFVLNRFSMFVNSILVNFGIHKEMHNPVLVLVLLGIVLVGAAFGYWLVRKFVVAEDGSVYVGVAQFVKWALRVVAVTFIFQSTLDPPLAMGLLVSLLGVHYSLTSFKSHGFSYMLVRSIWIHQYGREDERDLKYPVDTSALRRSSVRVNTNKGAEFLRRSGTMSSRGSLRRSPKRKPVCSNSPVKGVVTPSNLRSTPSPQEYYSTFHRIPNRKKFSEEEWEDFTEQSTEQGLAELTASAVFPDWLMNNADRIQLKWEGSSDVSIGSGYDSSEENITE